MIPAVSHKPETPSRPGEVPLVVIPGPCWGLYIFVWCYERKPNSTPNANESKSPHIPDVKKPEIRKCGNQEVVDCGGVDAERESGE